MSTTSKAYNMLKVINHLKSLKTLQRSSGFGHLKIYDYGLFLSMAICEPIQQKPKIGNKF